MIIPMKRGIDRSDILDWQAYARVRPSRRAEILELKKRRRLQVGPNATLIFECYATMLYQIQEMLHVERGGPEQLEDELAAYAPLVPRGNELVATFMLEYPDAAMRVRRLAELGGIERTVVLRFQDHAVAAVPENDVERTTAAGKTSSVHFLRFPMAHAQAEAFRGAGVRVLVAIEHAKYGHMAVMPEEMRAELARDL